MLTNVKNNVRIVKNVTTQKTQKPFAPRQPNGNLTPKNCAQLGARSGLPQERKTAR